jgi:DNA invertase Pin-like site-specific DNA recombinase
MEEKKVGIYARVSTKNNGQNPETQLVPLREFCKQRKFIEYVDEGVSGAKESRPQLDRLMEDARHGLLSTVVVWRFDRFARSTSHLDKALKEFKELKVSFVSMTESVDTSTATGKLVFTIIGAVAEMEREIIKERVKTGMKRVMGEIAAGLEPLSPDTGKPKQIGGWRATRKDGSPRQYRKPKAPNSELVAQVKRLKEKGLTLRSIAEEVKKSHTLVARLLKTQGPRLEGKGAKS